MRQQRQNLVFALVLAFVLSLAGCAREEKEPDEFRIGLLGDFSKVTSSPAHVFAQARVAELNGQGGLDVAGRKIPVRLIVADSGGGIENTMSALTRLIQQERVSAVVGPYLSREAIPVAAALETLRVPMISPSATNPEVTRGRKFAFRVCQRDNEQGAALARYAYEDLGLRRVAVLFDESDVYSSGLAGYFRTAFVERSGATVLMEPFKSGDKDFMVQLARIRESGAQALLLPNFPADLALQLPQARAAGFAGQFLGSDSWDSDHVFHSLPEVQGALFSMDFCAEAADPQLLTAAQALAAKANVVLDENLALTLDALDLLFTAASRGGSTDPVSLRSGLASIRDHKGLTGTITFSNGGDPIRPGCLVGIDGGVLTLRARLNSPRQ
jgi:branched-chain amino acid transport system substrate-binding protein